MSLIDEGAITPSLDPLIPEDVLETQDTQQESLNSDDVNVASLLYNPGFAPIKKRLEEHVNNFQSGKGLNFDANTPMDVIGQKYVVSSTIAGICKELLDMVTNAATAVAERENDKRGKQA